MKRFSTGLIAGLLIGLLLATTSFALADQPIKLWINGKIINCDVPPQSINGRVLVPARFVAEALGAQVGWDAGSQTVLIWTKEYEASKAAAPQPNTSNPITPEHQEFSTKALALLELCSEVYEFAGSDSGDVSQAKSKLNQLEASALDLRALSAPDEYKEFKKMLLDMSDSLQQTANYLILYLESNNSYDRYSYILKRNDCFKTTVELLADCTAEMNSLKKKGLL